MMPNYDHHDHCIACIDKNHKFKSCALCKAFPIALRQEREKAMAFKRSTQPKELVGWSDLFYSNYPSLDAWDEGEEDISVVGAIESSTPMLSPLRDPQPGSLSLDLGTSSAATPSSAPQDTPLVRTPISATRGILAAAGKRAAAALHRLPVPKMPRLGPSPSLATRGRANPSRTPSPLTVPKRVSPAAVATSPAIPASKPPLEARVESMEQRMDSIADNVAQMLALMTNKPTAPAPSTVQQVPKVPEAPASVIRQQASRSHAVVAPPEEPVPFSTFNPPRVVQAPPPSPPAPLPMHNREEAQVEEDDQSSRPGEQRRLWLDSLRILTPHLDHPEVPQAPPQSGHFAFLQAKPSGDDFRMPFIPELASFINNMGEESAFKRTFRSCPFKKVNSHYPTSDSIEDSLLGRRVVPRALMDEVPEAKLHNPGACPSSIRLRTATAEGQREQSASVLCDQATALLRIVNSQELTTQALASTLSGVAGQLDTLAALPNIPQEASDLVSNLQQGLQLAFSAQADLEQSIGYLTPCAVHQFITAHRARQRAWLSASNLPATFQQELARMDLPQSSPGSSEPLPVVSSEAQQLIKARLQKRHDDVYRDWHIQRAKAARGRSSASRGRTKSAPKKKQPQKAKAASTSVPLEPQAASWSAPPAPATSSTRGRRAGRRSGRGRGVSSSQASASQK